ncbi:MAG: DUF1573 domain-containing protein [Candidatus Binataceae bacterium]|jgi:hypothetical protein
MKPFHALWQLSGRIFSPLSGLAPLVAMLALLVVLAGVAAAQSSSGLDLGSPGSPAAGAPAGGLQNFAPSGGGSGARIQLIDPVYDFGIVTSGVPVTHVFKIRNTGTGDLIIGGVNTSCGCTAAKPTKSVLASGEETEIKVTFDTRFDRGPATRTITVLNNDPKDQQAELTIKGDVKVQVAAEPSEVAFGNVKHGVEQTREVMITDLVDGKNLKIINVSKTNPGIQVTPGQRTDGKPGAAISVTLLPTMSAGPFDDTIKLATSRAPLDISVFGTVQGDITVNPPQVSFGIVSRHQSALRIVRLVNGSARTVNVTGVSSTSQNVSAAVEPVTPGKEYKITLQLAPDTPDGAVRGRLAIHTDDPEQETVSLPFYGIVGSFRG